MIFNDHLKKKIFNLLLNTSKELTSLLLNGQKKDQHQESDLHLDYNTPSDFNDLYQTNQSLKESISKIDPNKDTKVSKVDSGKS